MKITVQTSVFKKFPNMSILAFSAHKVDNITHKDQAGHLVEEASKLTQLTFKKKILKHHHKISPWVMHQKHFGPSSAKYHTSVEILLKKSLAKQKVAAHNTLTNILRYMTLRHLVPIGVDDFNKIKGNLTFGIATGHERAHIFAKVKKGALYYSDEKRVLGTKLDYWKSPRTAVHKSTKSAIFHVLCMPPVTEQDMRLITEEMQDLLEGFCGAKVNGLLINSKKPSITIK